MAAVCRAIRQEGWPAAFLRKTPFLLGFLLAEREGLTGAFGPRPPGDACASSKIAFGDFVEPHFPYLGVESPRCRCDSNLNENVEIYVPYGGEGGIRTLDGLLTHTPLAGARLRPLGHLSGLDLQAFAERGIIPARSSLGKAKGS